tara:strand:- start:114075 stop:115115 length:1041 start_codon:yes stop_codon:yes gene_type:complete
LKVLIVDDSVVYRSAIKMALAQSSLCETVDTANNGKAALDKLKTAQYDIVTLDIEMPVMDGVEAIQEIRKINKEIPIIVFSAQNNHAASKALRALENGASDIVKKIEGSGDISENLKMIQSELLPRFKALVENSKKTKNKTAAAGPVNKDTKAYLKKSKPQFLGIGSSTGGPDTLKSIISKIKHIHVPIFIVQHMPPVFTTQLAKALDKITHYTVVEAANNMQVQKDHIYIAPGDYHMRVVKAENGYLIRLDQSEKVCFVRPAVDVLFKSMSETFSDKPIACLVLTGMGSDGAQGSQYIKSKGGTVLIQDESSSIVWGMPKAVFEINAYDDILHLDQIPEIIDLLS